MAFPTQLEAWVVVANTSIAMPGRGRHVALREMNVWNFEQPFTSVLNLGKMHQHCKRAKALGADREWSVILDC